MSTRYGDVILRSANDCWFCGQPGSASSVGSILCPACRAKYDEYYCAKCGQNCCTSRSTPHSDVCASCLMRERAALLPPSILEPIRAEVAAGRTISAIRLARETLDWPLRDAIELADSLRQMA